MSKQLILCPIETKLNRVVFGRYESIDKDYIAYYLPETIAERLDDLMLSWEGEETGKLIGDRFLEHFAELQAIIDENTQVKFTPDGLQNTLSQSDVQVLAIGKVISGNLYIGIGVTAVTSVWILNIAVDEDEQVLGRYSRISDIIDAVEEFYRNPFNTATMNAVLLSLTPTAIELHNQGYWFNVD